MSQDTDANTSTDAKALRAMRRAYEAGRLRAALPWALFPVTLGGVAYIMSPERPMLGWTSLPLALGLLLGLGALGMHWIGKRWGQAAKLGFRLGALPYAGAMIAPLMGHACAVGACTSWCMPLCAAAGSSAGWLMVKPIQQQKLGLGYGVLVGVIIVGVGAMACTCMGISSTIGAAAGLLAGSALRLPLLATSRIH